MDPQMLMMLMQHLHQSGQLPQMGGAPDMGAPQQGDPSAQGQLPSMAPPAQPQQQHKGGGLNPMMALSPLAGMMGGGGKGLGFALSPLAGLFGAFK